MERIAEVLREEHGMIRRAAACLFRLADDVLEGEELDARAAVELVEFFEEFADGAHQEKEERCLFPALLASGLAPRRVAELVADHGEERALLEGLRHGLEAAAYGDSLSRDAFAQRAQRYALLQVSHASVEDDVLLPLVGELLDAQVQRDVLAGFERVAAETLRHPAELHATRLRRIATELGSIAPASAGAPSVAR